MTIDLLKVYTAPDLVEVSLEGYDDEQGSSCRGRCPMCGGNAPYQASTP